MGTRPGRLGAGPRRGAACQRSDRQRRRCRGQSAATGGHPVSSTTGLPIWAGHRSSPSTPTKCCVNSARRCRLIDLKIAGAITYGARDRGSDAGRRRTASPAVVLGGRGNYGVNNFLLFARCLRKSWSASANAVRGARLLSWQWPGRDKETTEDFTEVIEHIGRLDFTRGARDLAGVVGTLHGQMPAYRPSADCRMGLTAPGELSPGWPRASVVTSAAAVLYFPSPAAYSAELSPARPVHPIDLLWSVFMTCPALFLLRRPKTNLCPLMSWRICAPGSITGGSTPRSRYIRGPVIHLLARGDPCVMRRQTGGCLE